MVIALEQMDEKGLELEDYAGLGKKHPWLAIAMMVAMLSFTGIPPTLGLVGKFFLFRTAIAGGFVGLALIGVITSLVSAFYYLRVVVIMYMREGDPQVSRATLAPNCRSCYRSGYGGAQYRCLSLTQLGEPCLAGIVLRKLAYPKNGASSLGMHRFNLII